MTRPICLMPWRKPRYELARSLYPIVRLFLSSKALATPLVAPAPVPEPHFERGRRQGRRRYCFSSKPSERAGGATRRRRRRSQRSAISWDVKTQRGAHASAARLSDRERTSIQRPAKQTRPTVPYKAITGSGAEPPRAASHDLAQRSSHVVFRLRDQLVRL